MKVGFVHKYWLEHLVEILVKNEMKHNQFIVVRSSLTYTFTTLTNQVKDLTQVKAKPLSFANYKVS